MAVHTFSNAVDNLFTTTLQLIRRRLADAIFKQNPFTFYMLARGRVKIESGGFDIREPIIYQKNPSIINFSGYDRLNVTPSQEVTEAIYQWRRKGGTVSISHEEMDKNAGAQAIFNLLKIKVRVLEDTMREDLNSDLMRVSSLKGSKEMLGLDNFIEQGTFGTVGGINGNTYTWWRNQWDSGGAQENIFAEFRKMYHDCSKGGKRPTLILCPQEIFEEYEKQVVTPTDDLAGGSTNAISGMLRFTDTRLADVGFDNLRFKGATMLWDEMLEDPTLRPAANDRAVSYFIHDPSLSLTIHRRRNFAMSPFQEPYDQDARVSKVVLAGNLTANNRRNLGGLRLT
jgi:hypothetical protein